MQNEGMWRGFIQKEVKNGLKRPPNAGKTNDDGKFDFVFGACDRRNKREAPAKRAEEKEACLWKVKKVFLFRVSSRGVSS